MTSPTTKSSKVTFCEQVSKEEMNAISKAKTAQEMFLLGKEIQGQLSEAKANHKTRNLDVLSESVSLSGMLDEFFDLDETHQKSRMLDLLTEITKLKKRNEQLKSSLDNLDTKLQEESERADELNEQCDGYIADLDKQERVNKTLRAKILRFEEQVVGLGDQVVDLGSAIVRSEKEKNEQIYLLRKKFFIFGTVSILYFAVSISPFLTHLFT